MSRFTIAQIILVVALSCVFTLGGCDRDDSIVAYSVPKDQQPLQSSQAMSADFLLDTAKPKRGSDAAAPLTWTLPGKWKEVPAGAVRFAAFAVLASDPKLLVTIVSLPPGQSIVENINRWEKQIGAAISSDSDAHAQVKLISTKNAELQFVALVGPASSDHPPQTILAAIAQRPDRDWFFKIQGLSTEVDPQRNNFDAFLKSLRFESQASSSDSVARVTTSGSAEETSQGSQPPAMSASSLPPELNVPQSASGVHWTAPSDWIAEPLRAMRLASFKTSADINAPEIVLSEFSVGGFGNMLDNVNRWRNMVKLPPISTAADALPTQLVVDGKSADVYDFAGDSVGNEESASRIRVACVPSPDGVQMLFVRFAGASAKVDAHRDAFDRFVQSIRFHP